MLLVLIRNKYNKHMYTYIYFTHLYKYSIHTYIKYTQLSNIVYTVYTNHIHIHSHYILPFLYPTIPLYQP